MSAKRSSVVPVLLAACAGLFVLAADSAPADGPVTRVVKYVNQRERPVGGQPTLVLSVASKYGGSQIELTVPNAASDTEKADPLPALKEALEGVKAGDFLKVTYAKQDGRFVLSAIEKHTLIPGETDPAAYEFLRQTTVKIGELEYPAVVMSKVDKEMTLVVPGKRDPQGTLTPDEAIMEQIKNATVGSLYNVDTLRNGSTVFIKTIRPYEQKSASSGTPSGPINMTGTFIWTGKARQNNDLKIVLTPTGPNEWTAVYTFTWSGAMTYTGVIKGNLKNGTVTGTGAPADKRRTFEFEGTAVNGQITFNHFETTGGRRVATGTGTMKLGS